MKRRIVARDAVSSAGMQQSGIPTDGEAARAFYQERLALFAQNVAGMTFVFYCLTNALAFVRRGYSDLPLLYELPANRMQLAAIAVMTLVWAIASRGSRSTRLLKWLDAGGTFIATSIFVAMGPTLAMGVARTSTDLMLMLVLFTYQWVRAVMMPTSARFTAGVAAASVAHMVLMTVLMRRNLPLSVLFSTSAGVYLWCALLIALCAMTSRVIYGLRAEVSEARRLGQYTLEEKIGEGGMGAVYRARHAMLRRPTAIKLLDPKQNGEASLARFEREVQLTSRLTHPKIGRAHV